MTTFLFWNIKRKVLTGPIAQLVRDNDVDVLVLAECEIPSGSLLAALNEVNDNRFRLPFSPSKRIQVFTRFPSVFLRPVADGPTYSIRRVCLPAREELTLVAVHMQSKLHSSESSQILACTQLVKDIEQAEERIGHRRTLLLGDFNMNPFEHGVIGAGGLHGVMTRERAAKGSRTVQGEDYRFFYNPMWACFGDTGPGPPGTYHSLRSELVCFFWNVFDQVMMRHELIPFFGDEQVKVVTKINGASLLLASGVPDDATYSDHLPISITLNH